MSVRDSSSTASRRSSTSASDNMAKDSKYYVVWKGRKPGIYTSWATAKAQIDGFSGASYKSFKSEKEARAAFDSGSRPKAENKSKFYVVWRGREPGIYTSWEETQEQIRDVAGPQFKAFNTRAQAEEAFGKTYEDYKGVDVRKLVDLSPEQLRRIGRPILPSISTDAACSGNPGKMEYQGVDNQSLETLFHFVFPLGTNNIGEFLGIVDGLKWLKKHNLPHPIYTDSRLAMGWIEAKSCRSSLPYNSTTAALWEIVREAEAWLKQNSFSNKILKWETKVWGEIPADFGYK